MKPTDLPFIPVTTVTNPGVVDPASQSYPMVAVVSKSQPAPQAPTVHSDGDCQRKDLTGVSGSRGVTATMSSAPVVSISGDSGQRLDLQGPVSSQIVSKGLPTNVSVADASVARYQPPTVAQTFRPAVNLAADTSVKGGGLPKNVLIR